MFKFILLGSRGSDPIGVEENSPYKRYGGNTTAFAIVSGDTLIAHDAGTGFRKWPWLLKDVMGREGPHSLSVLFSHYHGDHKEGLAHSPLLFDPNNNFDFYGPDGIKSGQGRALSNLFPALCDEPNNPALGDKYLASMKFTDLPIDAPSKLSFGDGNDVVNVTTLPVQHGDITAFAYRMENNGRVISMISDTHHDFFEDTDEPIVDEKIVDFIRGSDALIYDSYFTDAELRDQQFFRGWGHSTVEQGVRLAGAADVPIFVAHHFPEKTDDAIDTILSDLEPMARKRNVHVVGSKPNLCLDLSLSPDELIKSLSAQSVNPEARIAAIRSELVL